MSTLLDPAVYFRELCYAVFARLEPRAVRAYRPSITYSFKVPHYHQPSLANEQFKTRVEIIANHLSAHIPPGFKMTLARISHGFDYEGFSIDVIMTINLELENTNGPTPHSPRRAYLDN